MTKPNTLYAIPTSLRTHHGRFADGAATFSADQAYVEAFKALDKGRRVMKCVDMLVQDHKIILRALDILEELVAKVANREPVMWEDTEVVLRFLRDFADDHHQTKEESALFPQLVCMAEAQRGPLRQMLFEHDQERSLVEGLEDALKTKKGMNFVHYANRLIGLLRNHISKEDTILFDLVESLISKEEDEKIAAEFEKFHVKPALLNDLYGLERKYLRRPA